VNSKNCHHTDHQKTKQVYLYPPSNLHKPTLAPSTPKKSHQKKKQHRSDVVADQRNKRQDTKATPKRKQKPPHPIITITQDLHNTDPSDASNLTPLVPSPPFVPSSTTPNDTIKTKALIRLEGYAGSTKPVSISTTNILAWFRDNAEAPLSGNSKTIYRGAQNVFQPVQHYMNTSDDSATNERYTASNCKITFPFLVSRQSAAFYLRIYVFCLPTLDLFASSMSGMGILLTAITMS
jgi:hypothetical protein